MAFFTAANHARAAVPAKAGTLALLVIGFTALMAGMIPAHAQPANPFPNCKLAATCGQTEAYSCPGNRMFYADAATHKLQATCPHTCTDFKKQWCEQNCPPKAWTCPKPEAVR